MSSNIHVRQHDLKNSISLRFSLGNQEVISYSEERSIQHEYETEHENGDLLTSAPEDSNSKLILFHCGVENICKTSITTVTSTYQELCLRTL